MPTLDSEFPWEGQLPELGDGPITSRSLPELVRAMRHHVRGMETVMTAEAGARARLVTQVHDIGSRQDRIDQDYWGPGGATDGWRGRMERSMASMQKTLEYNTARLRGMRTLGTAAVCIVPVGLLVIDKLWQTVPK